MQKNENPSPKILSNEEEYTLLTNEQLCQKIETFGDGKTEFHTKDIQRLLNDFNSIFNIAQALHFALMIDGRKDMANIQLLKTASDEFSRLKLDS